MSSRNGSVFALARRRLGLEINPLQRPSDRFQAKIRVVVFVLFLVSCAIAVASGQSAYEQERARAHNDAEVGYYATARVVSTTLSAADPQSGATQRVVNVRWTDHNESPHRQRVVIPDGRQVRGSVRIWVDGSEHAQLVKPPESRSVATGFGAGFLVVFTSIFVLAAAYGLVAVALNRRRMHAWQREWRIVEPDWRKRVL